jgi:hypothetical protein
MAAPQSAVAQGAAPARMEANDAVGFKAFSDRVQAYVTLQKSIDSKLPAMKPTDLPEMITAHQQALARKIREARPHAKPGDLFTSKARDAFRHASRVALTGPNTAKSLAYMKPGAANPAMRLVVNETYPDTEPITAPPPELLAKFPPLPTEVAYRVVGRTLIVIDVKSRLIVDIARDILPQA